VPSLDMLAGSQGYAQKLANDLQFASNPAPTRSVAALAAIVNDW
jgi:hypothetical protein